MNHKAKLAANGIDCSVSPDHRAEHGFLFLQISFKFPVQTLGLRGGRFRSLLVVAGISDDIANLGVRKMTYEQTKGIRLVHCVGIRENQDLTVSFRDT